MSKTTACVRCPECLDGLINLRRQPDPTEMRGNCDRCGLALSVRRGIACVERPSSARHLVNP